MVSRDPLVVRVSMDEMFAQASFDKRGKSRGRGFERTQLLRLKACDCAGSVLN